MAQVKLYNTAGKEQGTIELSDAVFAVPVQPDLVHQVYVSQRANARQPWAHSKDRSDVRGGGRKPWRQKGTGRARHGSIRSPIWRGGGVTFGPLNLRNYIQKINKKVNRSAVKMCLSAKLRDELLVVVDTFATEGKTKAIAALRAALPGQGKSTLMLSAGKQTDLLQAARNVPRTRVTRAQDVSVKDLLENKFIIISKDAVATLEKRLG